jgi:Cu-Zn family superoxide dismutase
MAVAVFKSDTVVGEAVAEDRGDSVRIRVKFSLLPPGRHGCHIHRAGDLRGEGCAGACDHWHVGPAGMRHGSGPAPSPRTGAETQRHTGDLGNVVVGRTYTYSLHGVHVSDLWGRSLIVHADEDDLGRGPHEDSGTTGHSGARIGCAIFGRMAACGGDSQKRRTQKRRA